MTNANDPIPKITRDDEAAASGNLVADNIACLKALFPEIVADGKIDFDVLRDLLGDAVEDREERYGLNWKGKRKARAFALTPSLGTLRPALEDSVEWDATRNILVEGDNLEVLKILRRSYAGKVNFIYIDPPYNSGNDFVYPDNYKDAIGQYLRLTGQSGPDGEALSSEKEGVGRFHTGWLNMIYPRLLLSKELLSDDGIIMISIDDREYERLAMVGEEIFGQENHIATFVWKRKAGGGDDSGHVAAEHEYILCYSKNENAVNVNNILHESPAMTAKYNKSENGRRYYLERLDKTSLTYNASMDFKIDAPDGTPISPPQPNPNHPTTIWRWSEDTVRDRKDEIVFQKDKSGEWRVYTRTWESLDGVTPRSLLTEKEHGRNRDGTQEVSDLLGPKVFSNPKPTKMLSHILGIGTNKESTVLDFFAGSGSTAHATMQKNAEDGGHRRFILVQIPESLDPTENSERAATGFLDTLNKPRNIAELTKERVRRAGAKIRKERPDAKVDTGFRVYKLATSNLKPWQPDAEDLEASILDAVDNVLPGRTEDDLLVELLLKTGIDLTLPEEMRSIAGRTVHALGGGTLIVCLSNVGADDAEALGQGMADWVDELDPVQTTVYFKDTGLGANGNRAATKANLAAILRQRLGDRIAKIASI
ncbi:site-specific DNA-methyltransferase [Sphingobium yanoikuyae]|uniref:site-specific DNA-methyltransferase n=1 Tax=Sphingobium yanoikuyae TaxID=13690 RepID=UPI0013E0A8B8|nr:site-specific DNA-methyltransferase [Sphingobium yanoikuyae]